MTSAKQSKTAMSSVSCGGNILFEVMVRAQLILLGYSLLFASAVRSQCMLIEASVAVGGEYINYFEAHESGLTELRGASWALPDGLIRIRASVDEVMFAINAKQSLYGIAGTEYGYAGSQGSMVASQRQNVVHRNGSLQFLMQVPHLWETASYSVGPSVGIVFSRDAARRSEFEFGNRNGEFIPSPTTEAVTESVNYFSAAFGGAAAYTAPDWGIAFEGHYLLPLSAMLYNSALEARYDSKAQSVSTKGFGIESALQLRKKVTSTSAILVELPFRYQYWHGSPVDNGVWPENRTISLGLLVGFAYQF